MAMQVGPKYDVVYLITKVRVLFVEHRSNGDDTELASSLPFIKRLTFALQFGYIHLYDVETGTCIYANRIRYAEIYTLFALHYYVS